MNYLKNILKYIPPVYLEENTIKNSKVFTSAIDDFDNCIKTLYNNAILDLADDEGLDIFGANLKRPRRKIELTEDYRAILKAIIYSKQTVPTHDNILAIVKKITGFYPTLTPLHMTGDSLENDHGYYIAYDLTNNFNNDVLDEIEKIVGSGVKVERDYFFNLNGNTLYPACAIYDNQIITVECNEIKENENLEIGLEYKLVNTVYDDVILKIGGE